MFVASHSARIVRREEDDKRSDILWLKPAINALRIDDRRLTFRGVPLHLPRRSDITRHDAVHTDIILTKIARERTGEALDRCLARLVEHQVRKGEVPADRSEIDDRSSASCTHARRHRLHTEELVLQVNREAVVPIIFGYFVELVTVVIRRIVHEYVEWAVAFDEALDIAGRRLDVFQVNAFEPRTAALRKRV